MLRKYGAFATVISQLHERLDHLVHYSSQLIFVSGKTIGEQQRHLERFLSQQTEDTEIAYLQINPALHTREIRQEIAMQLRITVEGSYDQPLNELLHRLNDYDGPVLICITQAHLLSQGMLNELWDLVLQSRFANNKQHLNVILFAEPQWAYQAQQALPARHSDQPLLFATESLPANAIDDYDAGMDNHNTGLWWQGASLHWLQQSVQRHRTSLLWTLALMLCTLIMAGTMHTLYPRLLDNWLTPKVNIAVPASLQRPAPLLSAQTQAFGQSWQELTTVPKAKPKRAVLIHYAPLLPETRSQTRTKITPKIVPASEVQIATQAITPPTINEKLPAAKSDQELINTSTPTATHNANDIGLADRPTLLGLDDASWLLQLVGMADKQALEQYLIRHDLQKQAWVYRTYKFNSQWYVVVLNIEFTTRQDALSNVNSLPPEIIAANPFAKSVAVIKREILTTNENNQ